MMRRSRRVALRTITSLLAYARQREDSAAAQETALRLIVWIARSEVDSRITSAYRLRVELEMHGRHLSDSCTEHVGRYITVLQEKEVTS